MAVSTRVLSALAALGALPQLAAAQSEAPFRINAYLAVPLVVSRVTAFALGAIEIFIIVGAILLAVILPTRPSRQYPPGSSHRGSQDTG
jgi:hypothetical protein